MGIKCFLFVFHPHHLMIHLSGHGGSGLRVRMRVCVCVRARVYVCVCVLSHVCACVWDGKSPFMVPPPVSARHRQVNPPGPGARERTTAPASLL